MTPVADLRRLLEDLASGEPVSDRDAVVMERGHRLVATEMSNARLSATRASVAAIKSLVGTGSSGGTPPLHLRESIRAELLKNRDHGGPLINELEEGFAPGRICQSIPVPRFTMEFATGPEFLGNGLLRRFSAASTVRNTLEVAALVGTFGLSHWPPTENVDFPLNRSWSGLAANIHLQSDGDVRELLMTVTLKAENVYPWGSVAAEGAGLAATVSPAGTNLPSGGLASAWCDVTLTVHTSTASHQEWRRIASRSSSNGVDSVVDNLQNGQVILPFAVLLAPSTISALFVLEVECGAFAEGADRGDARQVFAQFECRRKAATEIVGLYTPPSQFRVSSISAQLCRSPIL